MFVLGSVLCNHGVVFWSTSPVSLPEVDGPQICQELEVDGLRQFQLHPQALCYYRHVVSGGLCISWKMNYLYPSEGESQYHMTSSQSSFKRTDYPNKIYNMTFHPEGDTF